MFVNNLCEWFPVQCQLKNKIDEIGFREIAIVTILCADIFKGENIIVFSLLNRSNWRVRCSTTREFRKLFPYAKQSLHNESPFYYGHIAVLVRGGGGLAMTAACGWAGDTSLVIVSVCTRHIRYFLRKTATTARRNSRYARDPNNVFVRRRVFTPVLYAAVSSRTR